MVTTDWVRITPGERHAGPDREQHAYAAVLRLSREAEAKIHSVEIEAKEIPWRLQAGFPALPAWHDASPSDGTRS